VQSSSIDLIKTKSSLTDDLIKWALTFGRLLIILVEIIAFSAFIYRFSLDRKLIDLNDKIKQDQAIVVSIKDREATYRNLQERIAKTQEISTKGKVYENILADIVKTTPPELSYNSLTVEDGRFGAEIGVTSISALTEYINSLKANPQISSVSITGIDNNSQTNSVTVRINARIKGAVK